MNIRFLPMEKQVAATHYWGVMRFLGRLASDTTMYAVNFADGTAHSWHFHRQDELIVVAKGRIEQLVAEGSIEQPPGPATHRAILNAGEAVHLPAGSWHSAQPLEPGTQVVFTINGGDGIYRAFELDGKELIGPSE